MRRAALLFVALSASWLSLSPLGSAADPGLVEGPPVGAVGERSQGNPLPRLMLWAWERPTDLRQLDDDIGVAFLAQTLTVRDGAVHVAPRRNPLRVAATTPLVAVTRIESGGAAFLPGSGHAASTLVGTMAAAIAGTLSLPRIRGLQIDFDATDAERPFYRDLVHAVRSAVGHRVPLSITALASWCAQDRWIGALPVDEAVPMLFRMGPLNQPYVAMARSPLAAAGECRGALGTSLDEPLHLRASGRRVYVFNASAWTATSVDQAREALE